MLFSFSLSFYAYIYLVEGKIDRGRTIRHNYKQRYHDIAKKKVCCIFMCWTHLNVTYYIINTTFDYVRSGYDLNYDNVKDFLFGPFFTLSIRLAGHNFTVQYIFSYGSALVSIDCNKNKIQQNLKQKHSIT